MSGLALAVPAYAHPVDDPDLWRRLCAGARHVRFAVVNVHDGPGAELDPAYAPVVEELHAARVRTVGYVDTDYGRRPVADVVADAQTWVTRYGVRGVFLDQVAGDFEHLQHYAACALGARAAGAQFVVLNPGTDCHPGYVDVGNVTVVFEGDWDAYRSWTPQPWTLTRPAGRFCHLVHGVPAELVTTAAARVRALHAGCGFLSPGTGANPWTHLPEVLLAGEDGAEPGPPPAARPAPWPARRYDTDPFRAAERPPRPSGWSRRLVPWAARRPVARHLRAALQPDQPVLSRTSPKETR